MDVCRKGKTMRVRCTRDLLAPALCSISRIAKKEIFPLYHAVLFTAIPGHMPEQGKLTLVGMGMLGTVGLFTQLPAIVEEEGQVLVPIEPLASYIETLHSGSLTLSQAREEIPLVEEQVQDQMALSLIAPERVAPLQIESASTSASGKCSINHARLHAWSSRHYPLPLVQDWGTNPAVTCTLQASLFKKALAACAPFAREGTGHKGSADEMYGVLVRL